MFDSVGWSEILVLLVLALFILGPERLPQAASWLGRNLRKIRELATGARRQLRDEIGPELDEWQQPLQELRNLRGFNPKRAITQQLLDDDQDPLGIRADGTNGDHRGRSTDGRSTTGGTAGGELASGERPPVDPDAT